MDFETFMQIAINEAGESRGDVPVGAILVSKSGRVVASAHNEIEASLDATAHAEILAIRRAGRAIGDWRLLDLTMFVTLEPCVMCAGAIKAARIPRVVFGAFDQRYGASGSKWDLLRDGNPNRIVEVLPGVRAEECAALLTLFFEQRRQ